MFNLYFKINYLNHLFTQDWQLSKYQSIFLILFVLRQMLFSLLLTCCWTSKMQDLSVQKWSPYKNLILPFKPICVVSSSWKLVMSHTGKNTCPCYIKKKLVKLTFCLGKQDDRTRNPYNILNGCWETG